MNYIKEINAFYQNQETNPLSSNAANLWHTLMHVNNRAGWKAKFTVSVSVLCSKSNLSNSTFKRTRKELRDKGYIRYESQGGNRAAIYEIVSLEQSTMDQNDDQNEGDDQNREEYFGPDTEVQSNVTQMLDHKAAPLFKQKETKQKITTTAAADAIYFFQENIGEIRPYIMDDLTKWINDVGQPLVLAAMKRGLERGKENWSYVKGILQAWLDKGIKTVGETEAELLAFKNKRKQKAPWAGPLRSEEIIPDWFHERNKERTASTSMMETKASEKERLEVDELLAAYV